MSATKQQEYAHQAPVYPGGQMASGHAPPAYAPGQPMANPPQYGYPPPGPVYAPAGNAPAGYMPVHPGPQQVVIVANQPLQGPVPDDYCTYSILNTIFCCFWIGIFAVIKSQSVRDAIMRGDRLGAESSSRDALRLNKIALGVGIGINIVYIACIILYIVFIVHVGRSNIYN